MRTKDAGLSQSARRRITKTVSYCILLGATVVAIFPLFWMFSSALRPAGTQWQYPPTLFPADVSFRYYERILFENTFLPNLWNSVIVSLSVTVAAVVLSIGAGYSISRFRYRGRIFLSRVILVAYMFPPILLIIPLFKVLTELGLIGTRFGLIVAQMTFVFPYCAWLLSAYFSTIPRALEEAAYVDGCGPLGALFRIVLPLARPGIVATAVFAFINSWKDFLLSFLIANDSSVRPLAIGLYEQVGGDQMVWGDIMAWSSLMTLPILLFFVLLQRYIVQGLTAGAVKG